MNKIKKIIIIIVIFISSGVSAKKNEVLILPSINPHNKTVKILRKEIKKSIYTIKSQRSIKDLPNLKFYKYKIKPQDTFWKILAQTSQNIDTLITVNNLDSPKNIKRKKSIFIPNMRGIIYKVKSTDTLIGLAEKFKVKAIYIKHVNKIQILSKKYIFIPCAKINRLERSLFLGTGFASPLKKYRKTSSFGNRRDPFHYKLRFHKGLDLACPIGTPVYASLDGTVIFKGYKKGYGKIVILKHKHGYQTYYGHLSRFKVNLGSKVKRGELIALSGNTGRSTGPHLHFEVRKNRRPINPGILYR